MSSSVAEIVLPSPFAHLEHPEDSRVVVVSCKEEFAAAAQLHIYKAYILPCDHSAEFILHQQKVLQILWDAAIAGNPLLAGMLDTVDFELFDTSVLEAADLKTLHSIENDMRGLYAAVKGPQEKIDFGLSLFRRPKHSDPYFYMNKTCGIGTGWFNLDGKVLYAPPGAIFGFEEGFPHVTPGFEPPGAEKEDLSHVPKEIREIDPRFTLVAGPL